MIAGVHVVLSVCRVLIANQLQATVCQMILFQVTPLSDRRKLCYNLDTKMRAILAGEFGPLYAANR